MGRSGRAGLCAPHRFCAVGPGIRRCVQEEIAAHDAGATARVAPTCTNGRSSNHERRNWFHCHGGRNDRRRGAGGRRWHAGLCLHGQGAQQCHEEAALHDVSAGGDPQAGGHLRPQRGGRGRGRQALRLPEGLHRLAGDGRGPRRPTAGQRRAQQPARRAVDPGRAAGQARAVREAAGPHRGRGQGHVGRGRGGRRSSTWWPSTTASCRPCA